MKRMLWNPWHGCHKCSPGCLNCYVYYLDSFRDIDSNVITRSKTNFNFPLKKNRQGAYKMESFSEVATCFTSDFFLPEADIWRDEVWGMIRKRSDVTFLICTKRIERFFECIPSDWGEGYENVIFAVTCENQQKADERVPILLQVPAKHKYIFAAPLLEYVDFTKYLLSKEIEKVSVGGESYDGARLCDFQWVQKIYDDCKRTHVSFDFHQTGSNFLFQGKHYSISHNKEYSQAKKAMEYLEKRYRK